MDEMYKNTRDVEFWRSSFRMWSLCPRLRITQAGEGDEVGEDCLRTYLTMCSDNWLLETFDTAYFTAHVVLGFWRNLCKTYPNIIRRL
jgi:hypothetical protein